jgi:TRAP-type C4-dicarboxylate transport system permease small subunit
MSRFFNFLYAALRRLAEACMVCLALLTLADVLGRYVFSMPLVGAVEVTELLMVGVIFSGIVLATGKREHVAVDLLALALGPRGQRVQRAASQLLAIAISLILGAVTWSQGHATLEYGDRTTMLGVPLAPAVFFMSAMLFLNAFVQAGLFWLDTTQPKVAND